MEKKPKIAMKKTVVKNTVVKPAAKTPAKVAVKTTKTVVKPKLAVKATPDSTGYFNNKIKDTAKKIRSEVVNLPTSKSNNPEDGKKMRGLVSERNNFIKDKFRQSKKGMIGFDANGYPLKTK